ncbi:MAG: hypothetical protein H6826_00975 [Planctomycetes bacterium]|nr:hypothetical protein [Planctomycetota bacterium]
MSQPIEPLAQARRRRAARAGEAALAIVLLLRLGGGLVDALRGPTREERARASAPLALRLGTATRDQLQWLPGMGPARAAAVITARPEGSRPWTWDDVLGVPGIGPVTVARWKRLAGVSP